jgi:hypothetical protein
MESKNSTGGATSSKREVVRAVAGVGGVRSSDDPVPDLWFGEPTEERRDATCSAVRKSSEGLVTDLWATSANNVLELQIHAGAAAASCRARNSESRMWKTACPV